MQKLQKRKVCRYYARGKCVKEDCPFVHQAETKKPCKFWTETGYRRKGKNCQFYHGTKQEEKKDKKFMQKHKGEQQQKIERNFIGQKKQAEQRRRQFQQQQQETMAEGNNEKTQFKTQQQRIQQKAIQDQANLKLNQQLLAQLQNQSDSQHLQFFKQYPKTFPDHSKTMDIKQHIKQVQQKFFHNKPFLQLLKQLPTKQQQQYYQIIRRYQDSFRLQDENQPKIYFINMRPILFNKQISLHFLFQEYYVELKVDQRLYPEKRAKFEILNRSVPMAYKVKLLELLDRYHEKYSVFESLKFFQNCFEKNYETVKFKLENQHFKKVELKQKIEQEKGKMKQEVELKDEGQYDEERQKHYKNKHGHHHDKNKRHHEEDKQQAEQKHYKKKQQHHHQNNHKQKKPTTNIPRQQKPPTNPIIKPQTSHTQKPTRQFRDYFQLPFTHHQKPQHQNLNDEITVQSLIMQNCPYIVIQKILLYIQCSCSKILMYLFDAMQKKQLKLWVKLKCKKCNDCVRIVWERIVVHNKGNVVGRMGVVNGKVVDVGGVGWKVGCNCDQEIVKPKLYLPGERYQLNCHSCFANMNVTYNGIKHFNPFVKEFQMQEDKQLPLRGACNHEKYHFRWIRYACCSRPFACEQCHDLGAVKQHQIVHGLTMICGFCAHQQNVADECSKCKKELIKGQDKAGHWQGGLGCRDPALLSKKDAKKYAGMGKVESNNKKKKEKEK